ncbi:Hypothetical predicted protein [Podarcis lilfordi]|uniref:Uncharacterized protein n=1 Tax=Podarcis lilfordi TaxID=74358 RepID=A0AA35PI61_9SAUR|nr:Hypothetical predicted protein [Podarcis lilfordi]
MKLEIFASYEDKLSSDQESSSVSSLLPGDSALGFNSDCAALSLASGIGASPQQGSEHSPSNTKTALGKPCMRRPKPPYLYIVLITMAIRDSAGGHPTG